MSKVSQTIKNFHQKASRTTLQVSLRTYKFAAFIKCVPFEPISKENLSVRRFTSKWKILAWCLANAIYTFAFLFQWLSFIHKAMTAPFTSELAVHLAFVANCSFGLSYMISILLRSEEVIMLLNQQVFMLQSLKRLELPEYKSYEEPFIIFTVNYMVYLCYLTWTVLVSLYVANPERSCYLYSYMPDTWKQYWMPYIILLLYEMSYLLWAVTILLVYYIYWGADMFMLNHFTRHLRKRKTVEGIDLKGYIYLQIFTIIFNDFSGSYFIVSYCFCIVSYPVAFFFVTLKYYHMLEIEMQVLYPTAAIFCTILIVLLTPQNALVKINSCKLLGSLRRRSLGRDPRHAKFDSKQKIIRKRVYAFAPLGIQLGPFGNFTFASTHHMSEQLCSNILLLVKI